MQTKLTQLLNIEFPLVIAPMFLISNEKMLLAAIENGVAAAIPAMNFLDLNTMSGTFKRLSEAVERSKRGTYGVNLIVQKTNTLLQKQLEVCVENKVPFFITSLGNPANVISAAHSYGAKVFCDVTNLKHAEKCARSGCDGFIAVGQGAGGHAGPHPLQILIPSLQDSFPQIPVIAAGGIANGNGMISVLALGAAGVSVGTRFIASHEASVSEEYKNAIVSSCADDIVLTERISGTPSSIINTDFAKRIGYSANWLEQIISKNPSAKKYYRKLMQKKGMKVLEKSITPGNYNNLWIAGKSVELIHQIKSCKEIISDFKNELDESVKGLNELFIK